MPLNADILRANLNHTFVETGTYLGEGIESAIEAGFQEIWSVDIDPERTAEAARKFENHREVYCKSGDSAMHLATLVPMLDKPATYWLDAHPVGYFNLLQPDLPLINELLAIWFHPGNSGDIILIDDLRLFDAEDQERLKDFIRLLWIGCRIEIIDSALIPQDILKITFP